MATFILKITDEEDGRSVNCKMEFDPPLDESTESETNAMILATRVIETITAAIAEGKE